MREKGFDAPRLMSSKTLAPHNSAHLVQSRSHWPLLYIQVLRYLQIRKVLFWRARVGITNKGGTK